MKLFYLADNRVRENWGGRSTSKALYDLLSLDNVILKSNLTFENSTASYNPDEIRGCSGNGFFDRIRMSLFHHSVHYPVIRKYIIKNDPYNIVKESIEESYAAYQRMMRFTPPQYYLELQRLIEECDALVINGEGALIFTNPPRYVSIFFGLVIRLALETGKKVFLLNSMFSDCPKTGCNTILRNEFKNILGECTRITARDPMSYRYFKENIGDNVEYVPDALFTWSSCFDNHTDKLLKIPYGGIPWPEYEKRYEDFDFSKPYICLSGSSLAAWTPREAIVQYQKLAQELKKRYKVFVVPTCSGDYFLEEVANKTGCPFIPVRTNIHYGMSILANAQVFISGRWHPSILASLGGTPCVFLGSNSHKTLSIQEMLDYNVIREYSAIPSDQDIPQIVNDVDRLWGDVNLRKKIHNKVFELSVLASRNRIKNN